MFGPEKGEGFNITSLNAFNATTGVAAPSNTVLARCDAVDSQTDPDVDPPSPCGINALVVAADGDYAVEETSMSYDPNAACSPFCGSPLATGVTWQQEVVEHTPQGNLVLTDISQDGSGGAGISDLTVVGSTLSWEQNGAHESAQLS